MSRKFKFYSNPYGTPVKMYKKGTITIDPGVTVLVGCNGCGKTTFLRQIQMDLDKKKIPNIYFDNLTDGGANARNRAAFSEDFGFVSLAFSSSEGENIVMNMGKTAEKIGKMVNLYSKDEETNELWILLDAVDSGLSIDNVIDMKKYLFDVVQRDIGKLNKDVYIIVSANEYEMAHNERCLDVQNMKYRQFKTYESFRKYILKSKEQKIIRDHPEKRNTHD